MYVRTRSQLCEVLQQRIASRDRIGVNIDKFAAEQYGIQHFSRLADKHWQHLYSDVPAGVLCRQIASATVEDVACFIGCVSLGLRPWVGQLSGDRFTTTNSEKVRYVKVPWIEWSRKGHLVKTYEVITTHSMSALEGMVLSRIQTQLGCTLPEWHAQLRSSVFGTRYPVLDFSDFFTDCLMAAGRKPPFVYLENGHGRCEKVLVGMCTSRLARPPANWYYPLYLSLFLDGRMVLLETYEDTRKQVGSMKTLFERLMREFQSRFGMTPIVVQIPEGDETNYCNKHILSMPVAEQTFLEGIEGCEDILQMFEYLVREIVSIGQPRCTDAVRK